MKKVAFAIGVIILLIGLIYILYCYRCYNTQKNREGILFLDTPNEVDQFVEEYGPFSEEDMNRIRSAEEDARFIPEWETHGVDGMIYIEVSPGSFWNPRMKIEFIHSTIIESF